MQWVEIARSRSNSRRLSRENSGVRTAVVMVAAILILGLSGAAAVLPLTFISEVPAVSTMMIVAGLLEMLTAGLRRANRAPSAIPGAVTVFSGLFLALDGMTGFMPLVLIVIGWLAARGLSLGIASIGLQRRPLIATLVAAVTDLVLAGILVTWLSATTFPLWMFGATPPILWGFAWVFAVSFLATGILLLEAADFERRPSVETAS